ncbi:MAG: carboxypeptidase regulatory-like domain-containing protein [Chitinophagales bacterium]|nr:carboxypeptidase regulatory-like domain-containing protein [Chitinophagales bacterium]
MSCKKPDLELGIVNGLVTDRTTNAGIPDATVYLLAHEPDGSIFGGGGGPSFEIANTTSDASGNFKFNFDYDSKYAYTCAAVKDLYFDYEDEFPVDEQVKEGVSVEVTLQPKAWLQIHFFNEYPSLPSDHFAINGFVTDEFFGDIIDTLITYIVIGNFMNVIHYGLEADLSNIDDTIYCPAFDTTYYEIIY